MDTTVYILYTLFALGAVGLYLALPSPQKSARIAGGLFGLAAVIGFVILGATRLVPDNTEAVFFCLMSAVSLFGAAKLVTHPRPVYSVLYFVLVVVAVACLMIVQGAEFLGIALIIVYAGAILVTYVFVIMLAAQVGGRTEDLRAREPLGAVAAGFITMAAVAGQIAQLPAQPASPVEQGTEVYLASADAGGQGAVQPQGAEKEQTAGADPLEGNTASLGAQLLSRYVIALEIAGLLLLVAMIGAIVLARKPVPRDVPAEPAPPPGKIGREVKPF